MRELSIQQSDELLPYTLVASHRRFHPHENPLFAYLVDHYSQLKRDEIKTNPGFEHMEEWDKDGRKALFFHLAFVPVDFPVFQNFDLTDLHLSVDYKLNVLVSKRYTLSDDGEYLRGILFDLFLQDNFEVFCMYVDQDMARDTGLQCLLPGIPYHAIGAIICFFYAHPHATAYLEKLFSRQPNIILPHIENLDLSLYQIQDKKIIRHKTNKYLIESQHRKEKIVLSDMYQHSSVTTLRLALQMYTGFFHLGDDPSGVSQSSELFRILAQYTR